MKKTTCDSLPACLPAFLPACLPTYLVAYLSIYDLVVLLARHILVRSFVYLLRCRQQRHQSTTAKPIDNSAPCASQQHEPVRCISHQRASLISKHVLPHSLVNLPNTSTWVPRAVGNVCQHLRGSGSSEHPPQQDRVGTTHTPTPTHPDLQRVAGTLVSSMLRVAFKILGGMYQGG